MTIPLYHTGFVILNRSENVCKNSVDRLSFRPLTGIVILNNLHGKREVEKLLLGFPSPYGDYDF